MSERQRFVILREPDRPGAQRQGKGGRPKDPYSYDKPPGIDLETAQGIGVLRWLSRVRSFAALRMRNEKHKAVYRSQFWQG